jgi:peptidyl-prolyl cis-trans isomerase SurA
MKRLLCCLLLATATLTPPLMAKPDAVMLDRVVALVDDGIILESEMLGRSRQISLQMGRRNTLPPPDEALHAQVLERMVVESIELQMAEKAGIRIDDNTINDTIGNIARQNRMTPEQFQAAIERDEGIPFRSFREQIRREMTITQLRQRRVSNRVKISDKDVDAFLESDVGKANLAPDYRLGHILIAVEDANDPAQKLSARQRADDVYGQLKAGADFAQMAAMWSNDERALDGGDLGWRKAGQLPTLFADVVIDMQAGDLSEPISSPSGFHIIKVLETRGGTEQTVDQTEARHILIKPNEIRSENDAKALISDIRARIASGQEDFAVLAKTYSDDPGSGSQGGALGWVNPGTMVAPFEQAMNASPLKQVSEPFRTQFGWHILEVTGRRSQDMSTEFKRNRARQMLFKRKYDEDLATWLREIRQDAFVEIKL